MKETHFHSLTLFIILTMTFLMMCSRVSLAETATMPQGVAMVSIDHGSQRSHRAALIIGQLGHGLAGSIALIARDSLYSKDLELARAVSENGAEWLGGQILEIEPTKIEYRSEAAPLYLSTVALYAAGNPATAACLGQIRPGQEVSVFTWTDVPASDARLSGRIDRLEANGFTVSVQGRRRPKPGDPVFVTQADKTTNLTTRSSTTGPAREVVAGLVAETLAGGLVRVVNLAAVFRGLPSDSASWAIEPAGSCAYFPSDSGGDSQPIADTVAAFVLKGMELLALETRPLNLNIPDADRKKMLLERPAWRDLLDHPGKDNPASQFKALLLAEWPTVRDALTTPGVEQYYFNPELPDRERFAQFMISIPSAMVGAASLRSEVQAANPVFKVTARRGSAEPLMGWGIAAGRLDSDIDDGMDKSTPVLLVLTPKHVVESASGNSNEIMVYPPALQGQGLRATLLPFEDPSLDLALLAVPSTKEVADEAFQRTGTSCSANVSGLAEIPVQTWGWRRAALSGTIAAGAGIDQILIKGMQIVPGFSGAALLQDALYVTGMVVSNAGDHANGVTIQAGMRLLPPGTAALRPRPDCAPRSLETGAATAVQKQLLGEKTIRDATASDLRILFGDTAGRIDPAKLPDRYISSWDDMPRNFMQAIRAGRLEGFCATMWPLRASSEADAKTGSCDLAELGQAVSTKLSLKDPLPICRVNINYLDVDDFTVGAFDSQKPTMRNVTMAPIAFTDGKFWDADSILACYGPLRITWYVPDNWVQTQALLAPPVSLVTVQGGTQRMSGCAELMEKAPGLGEWPNPECSPGPGDPPFSVEVKAFEIGRFPVMVSQYAKCVTEGKCHYSPAEPDIFHAGKHAPGTRLQCNWGDVDRESHPMNCISWQQAKEYCEANGGHLPTDVEWERAISGSDWQDPGIHSLVSRWGTMGIGHAPTLRSVWGLEDAVWHVLEWTDAEYRNYAGHVLAGGTEGDRTIRGGDFGGYNRKATPVGKQEHDVGFRCVYKLRHPFAPLNGPA